MDMVTKIIALIGSIIGICAAMGVMYGINQIRSGMSNEDSRLVDKGVTAVIVGGAVMLAIAGIVAYVINQVNAIKF